jgi:hypothetical protein
MATNETHEFGRDSDGAVDSQSGMMFWLMKGELLLPVIDFPKRSAI